MNESEASDRPTRPHDNHDDILSEVYIFSSCILVVCFLLAIPVQQSHIPLVVAVVDAVVNRHRVVAAIRRWVDSSRFLWVMKEDEELGGRLTIRFFTRKRGRESAAWDGWMRDGLAALSSLTSVFCRCWRLFCFICFDLEVYICVCVCVCVVSCFLFALPPILRIST